MYLLLFELFSSFQAKAFARFSDISPLPSSYQQAHRAARPFPPLHHTSSACGMFVHRASKHTETESTRKVFNSQSFPFFLLFPQSGDYTPLPHHTPQPTSSSSQPVSPPFFSSHPPKAPTPTYSIPHPHSLRARGSPRWDPPPLKGQGAAARSPLPRRAGEQSPSEAATGSAALWVMEAASRGRAGGGRGGRGRRRGRGSGGRLSMD